MKTHTDDRVRSEQYGLTKLEYFTAAALTGMLANPAYFRADNIGAKAVNYAIEVINELNAKHEMDNQETPPPAPVYNDSDDDDIPW